MALIHDDALVLARLDYSETSQILALFTRGHGKLRAIAKGIKRGTKKRFAVGIDLLEAGAAVLSVRRERSESLATLTEWKQSRVYSGLRENLARLHAAQYAAEITLHLTEEWDPHESLFDALGDALLGVSAAVEPLPILVDFQRRLLEAIGLWPRFDVCMLCARTGDLTHFSSFEGGMICRHCEPGQVEKWQVTNEVAGLLNQPLDIGRRAALGETAELILASSQVYWGAFAVLNYHMAHHMGREPVMARLLRPLRR